MTDYLERLHEVQIEILDYVDKICKENNLTYILAYGSALGAYRHQGFIPWDDDIDIAMPRNDYEKFIEIMLKSDDQTYSLQNEVTEKNYFLSFAKVRKNNTLFLESIVDNRYQNNGIFIDVFPLDRVSDLNSWSFKFKYYLIAYLRHGLKFNNCLKLYQQNQNVFKFALDFIACLPLKLFSNQSILAFIKKIMINFKYDINDHYLVQTDDLSLAKAIKAQDCFPAKKIYFHNKNYFGPNNITSYLTKLYGQNYMELPPESERRTHDPLEIRF